MSPPPAFAAVKEAWPDAEFWEEGGLPYIFFPVLKFVSGDKMLVMKALLCPAHGGSYPTRLFLENQVPNRGENWKNSRIRGHSWWVCSWKDVPASLPWLAILANHLRPLR